MNLIGCGSTLRWVSKLVWIAESNSDHNTAEHRGRCDCLASQFQSHRCSTNVSTLEWETAAKYGPLWIGSAIILGIHYTGKLRHSISVACILVWWYDDRSRLKTGNAEGGETSEEKGGSPIASSEMKTLSIPTIIWSRSACSGYRGNLEAALEQFRAICEDLSHNSKTKSEKVITQDEEMSLLWWADSGRGS